MHTRRALLCLMLLLGLTLGCGPLSSLGSTKTPIPITILPTQGIPAEVLLTPTLPEDSQVTLNDLVKGAISLRSVKFHLSTTRLDVPQITIEAEIDSVGSQHVVKVYPDNPNSLFENGVQNPPTKVEFYVLNGIIYSPDEKGTLQVSEAKAMSSFLHAALLSSDGPAFWLAILPSGTITPAGEESYAGFQAQKYDIHATLEDLPISGAMWIEPSLPALLGATLIIPAKLAGPETEGDLQIDYQVEKAEVALIQPGLSAPVPSATPGRDMPGGLSVFSDARNIVSQPGFFMFDSDADVATIKQFYLDQLNAGGWTVSSDVLEKAGAYISTWTKGTDSLSLAITANPPSGSLVMISCEGCK